MHRKTEVKIHRPVQQTHQYLRGLKIEKLDQLKTQR